MSKAVFTLMATLASASFTQSIQAAPAPTQLPTGGQVSAGSATINTAGNTTTINQVSDRAAINWTSFDIGSKAAVNFVQPSTSAVALNRINSANPSQIYGSLTANGQVFFSNPAGMYFAPGANVNVGAIVGTTHQMSDTDFMKGSTSFDRQGATGSIINEGVIQTGIGGYIALLAPSVRNSGLLIAQQGTVALAGGERITLNFGPLSNLQSLTITNSQLATLIENRLAIQAPGGLVILSAKAVNQVAGSVINSGTIAANGAINDGGRIILEASSAISNTGSITADAQTNSAGNGGTISIIADLNNPNSVTSVSGSISAKGGILGGNGGFIETSGSKVQINDAARIDTSAPQGLAGTLLIDPTDFTIASSGGDITGAALSTLLSANSVTVQTGTGTNTGSNRYGSAGLNGDIFVNDPIAWSANTGLTLNAWRNINVNSAITATGASGNVALYYGQGAVNAGNAAVYNINAPINLKAGYNFKTKLGSDGSIDTYRVITDLGTTSSMSWVPSNPGDGTLQGMQSPTDDGKYVLGANIDASATHSWTWFDGAKGFHPLNPWGTGFKGAFDGLGHTISNLYINTSGGGGAYGTGLFESTTNAKIQNLTIALGFSPSYWNMVATDEPVWKGVVGVDSVGALVGKSSNTQISNVIVTLPSASNVLSFVSGANAVGGLVGQMNGGSINNSNVNFGNSYLYPTKIFGANYVGGLVGQMNGGSVANSYVRLLSETDKFVQGTNYVGGLIGEMNGGSVANSYVQALSYGAVSGSSYVGGLVGHLTSGSVTNSFASVEAKGDANTGAYIGGLVGYNDGEISNSYSGSPLTNSVRGHSNVGGLVGYNDGSISNSYSTAAVYADNNYGGLVGVNSGLVGFPSMGIINKTYASGKIFTGGGGLVGTNTNGVITNSYWDVDSTRALTSAGGIGIYSLTGSVNAYNPSTYAGFDLTNTWWMVPGIYGTRPILRSEYSTTINNSHQLQLMALNPAASYTLGHSFDMTRDMTSVSGQSPGIWSGSGFVPVGDPNTPFTGNFNGGGYTITGLMVSRPGTDYVGLFGSAAYGTVSNLGLINEFVSGHSYVGGLIGYGWGFTVNNVYETGTVNGWYEVGGLVGWNWWGPITNSHASANVSGSWVVGGLVGFNNQAPIRKSYATGNVSGIHAVGGLIGWNNQGPVTSSYATGAVTASNGDAGGLVGDNIDSSITDSNATGFVNGTGNVGALSGFNNVASNVVRSPGHGQVTKNGVIISAKN